MAPRPKKEKKPKFDRKKILEVPLDIFFEKDFLKGIGYPLERNKLRPVAQLRRAFFFPTEEQYEEFCAIPSEESGAYAEAHCCKNMKELLAAGNFFAYGFGPALATEFRAILVYIGVPNATNLTFTQPNREKLVEAALRDVLK